MRLRKQVRRGRTFWSQGPSEFCVNKAPLAGNLEQALSDCENALDSSIETHDVNGESLMRTDLAAIYYQRGDLKEAEKMSRQALAGFRQVGNLSGAATALSNIAAVRVSLGDLPDAKRLLEESIPDYQATEDKEGVALNLNNLGDLSRQNGNLKTADVFMHRPKLRQRKSTTRMPSPTSSMEKVTYCWIEVILRLLGNRTKNLWRCENKQEKSKWLRKPRLH